MLVSITLNLLVAMEIRSYLLCYRIQGILGEDGDEGDTGTVGESVSVVPRHKLYCNKSILVRFDQILNCSCKIRVVFAVAEPNTCR